MSDAAPAHPREERSITLDSVEQLKAIADPLRLQLLTECADEPRTVKQLAAALDAPPTRLYYHVKMLERLGFLEVATRRMVSGIEERSYIATATGWNVSPDLTGMLAETGVVRAALDLVGAGLEVALAERGTIGEPTSAVAALSYTRFYLTPEEVADVHQVFAGLMAKYSTPSNAPDKKQYDGFFTFYRTPTSAP